MVKKRNIFSATISYGNNFPQTAEIDRRKDKDNCKSAKHPNWLVYIGLWSRALDNRDYGLKRHLLCQQSNQGY